MLVLNRTSKRARGPAGPRAPGGAARRARHHPPGRRSASSSRRSTAARRTGWSTGRLQRARPSSARRSALAPTAAAPAAGGCAGGRGAPRPGRSTVETLGHHPAWSCHLVFAAVAVAAVRLHRRAGRPRRARGARACGRAPETSGSRRPRRRCPPPGATACQGVAGRATAWWSGSTVPRVLPGLDSPLQSRPQGDGGGGDGAGSHASRTGRPARLRRLRASCGQATIECLLLIADAAHRPLLVWQMLPRGIVAADARRTPRAPGGQRGPAPDAPGPSPRSAPARRASATAAAIPVFGGPARRSTCACRCSSRALDAAA